jgi:endoglucanase
MHSWRRWVRGVLVGSLTGFATAAVGAECQYGQGFARGISLASGEFQPEHIPGVYNRDYVYPPAANVEYYKTRGFDLVRLPFLWERLQRSLFAEFDSIELARIRQFLAIAHDRCIRVLLSPHNYGRYSVAGKQIRIGSAEVPDAAFADFWRRMAAAFRNAPDVYAFSLMNEPFDMNGTWKRSAQVGLDAIRSVDASRLVLAPGDQWSGAWSWRRFNDDFLLRDPADHLIYEAHQYFDGDHSGTYRQTYDQSAAYPEVAIDLVRPFADWLRLHHATGVIGEFGVPNDDPRWLEVADMLLPWLAREHLPWIYWAGGPRWGNYPLSAEPRKGGDAPVMRILTKYSSQTDQPGMRAPDPH